MQKNCTDHSVAKRAYGEDMAKRIAQRVNEIHAAISVEMMVTSKIGRCHALSGKRQGQYAVDLIHPYRLVFNVKQETVYDIAVINEVVDYH